MFNLQDVTENWYATIDIPKIAISKFDSTKIDINKIDIRHIDIPKIDIPKINIIKLQLNLIISFIPKWIMNVLFRDGSCLMHYRMSIMPM